MDRAPRSVLANKPGDERLDAWRLDLDVDHGVSPNGIEHCAQCRNRDALPQGVLAELVGPEVSDAAWAVAGRVQYRIVVDDDNPVGGRMDVELDGVRTQLDRAEESGNGVLRQRLVRAAVGDFLGRGTPGRRVQAFLRVVVLGTMTAKL